MSAGYNSNILDAVLRGGGTFGIVEVGGFQSTRGFIAKPQRRRFASDYLRGVMGIETIVWMGGQLDML
jgi:hypothetical protein